MKTKILDKYIFKNGNIYSPYNKKMTQGDILIVDGVIEDVNYSGKQTGFNVIDCSNKIICPGFLDLRAHFGEPGFEDVESLDTGSKAALSGGYTKVCMLPNTNPVLDSVESIESILRKIENCDIDIYPIGSVTKNLEGQELSEIGLMAKEGIVAISDAGKNIKNSQVMRNALEYAKMFDIPVINHAEDIDLVNDGIGHESEFSTQKGLPANPPISETVGIFRDLEIASYVNGKIHIPHISSKDSLTIIERYKNKGLSVTVEVTPHHLGLSEVELDSYNAFYKVSPPLRTQEDSHSLIEGLRSGLIDCISSDHYPRRIEDKESDLLNSKFGVVGLESAFAYSNHVLSKNGFKINDIIDLFTIKPSKAFNIELNAISKNVSANFIVVDPDTEWTFSEENIFSMSKNSALLGKPMKGKVEIVACKNKIHTI